MILLVDDDPRSLRAYCDELDYRRRSYRLVGSIDEAVRVLRQHAGEIELVVWDMMMPHGKTYVGEDHEGGLRTGELFYRSLRSVLPEVPAMLFTNRNVALLDGPFRNDPLCACRMKEELLPGEFVDFIEALLSRASGGGAA